MRAGSRAATAASLAAVRARLWLCVFVWLAGCSIDRSAAFGRLRRCGFGAGAAALRRKMCLVPGMLENAPARPSPRAGRLAAGLMGAAGTLAAASVLLVISYSVWGVLQNALFVVYAYMVLRPFRGDDPLVFVENVLCFAILAGLNGVLAIFNLVNLATQQQALYDKLAHWQVIVGLVLASVCVACYVVLALVSLLLFRDLRESVLQVDEETAPFIPGGGMYGAGAAGAFRDGTGFGSFGYPPTGTYARTDGAPNSHSDEANLREQRFPGKGYKLSD